MLSKQQTYRRIVSGQDQRLWAQVVRLVLRGMSVLYAAAVRTRNWLYEWGLRRSFSVDVPVVCVGNITTGGTGKTPLVIWLCNHLAGKGLTCAILTRGYKTRAGQMSDEPALLARGCEGAAVVVNPDRVAGAKKAVSQHGAQILVMDDGFGHRRLRRDANIVTIDATCPFGYGRLLPGGLLREPLSSLARAAAVVLTRTDQVNTEALEAIERQIRCYAPAVPIARTVHRLGHAVCFPERNLSLETLGREPIFAFCGIGNPDAFFDSLRRCGLTVCGVHTFDDHHEYTEADMDDINSQAHACGATTILCTQKDWVKSANLHASEEIIFAYLTMELDFIDGFDTIAGLVDKLVLTSQRGRASFC